MTKKAVLSKVLPAVLVFILAILLVLVISSCSRTKKTPTGGINDEEYVKMTLEDGTTYSVSKLDFYNKLRYIGYDVFEDEFAKMLFSDITEEIEADLEANKTNVTNAKYFKKFERLIDSEAYGTSDKDELADYSDEEIEDANEIYLSNVKLCGYDIQGNNIYQYESCKYQLAKLVKQEFARRILTEEAVEEDGDYEITDDDVKKYFQDNYEEKGDFSALLMFFASGDEAEEVLKQLNLKFVGNKLYRINATLDADTNSDSKLSFEEYSEYYDNYDTTKDGVSNLSDNEVLFEFCRVYNYLYTGFRPETRITMIIDSKDYLAETYVYNPIELDSTKTYSAADYSVIKNYSLDDMINNLLAQDNGTFDELKCPRLKYTYDVISDIDTTLATDLYRKYGRTNSTLPMYNTPASTYASGNYLAFKLEDAFSVTYENVKSLANASKAFSDASTDATAAKAFVHEIKEAFEEQLRALEIFDDSDKIKTWTTNYASKITVDGITGAQAILDSCAKKDADDSIYAKLFEEQLTDEYIAEKISEYLEDNCKVTIYDSLFEAQFLQEYDFYKKGNKQSDTLVAKVEITDEETDEKTTYELTADTMFEALNKKYGSSTLLQDVSQQILIDKYYSQISQAELKDYSDNYDQILTYFASGQSNEYGFNAKIGQKAFIQLYFRAENKEDAIKNMWVADKVRDILMFESITDLYPSAFANYKQLTESVIGDFVHMEYNTITVSTDDDDNGKTDDWTDEERTSTTEGAARKKQIEEMAAALINIINDRLQSEYTNSNKDSAYSNLVTKYNSASRVFTKDTNSDGVIDEKDCAYYYDETTQTAVKHAAWDMTFESEEEKEAYYFASFKQLGLRLLNSSDDIVKSFDDLDGQTDECQEQLQEIYKWIIENWVSASNDYTFAQNVKTADGSAFGTSGIDKAISTNLFLDSSGYTSFYILQTEKAPSFIFNETDNPDDDVDGKVYPYSINPEDPFPVGEDGKPIDNSSDTANTLYNANNVPTENQIKIYLREYENGVESLSDSVAEALDTYFKTKVYKYFTSNDFVFVIDYKLMNEYISAGKLTVNADLLAKASSFVENEKKAVFNFETSDFITKWWTMFN